MCNPDARSVNPSGWWPIFDDPLVCSFREKAKSLRVKYARKPRHGTSLAAAELEIETQMLQDAPAAAQCIAFSPRGPIVFEAYSASGSACQIRTKGKKKGQETSGKENIFLIDEAGFATL